MHDGFLQTLERGFTNGSSSARFPLCNKTTDAPSKPANRPRYASSQYTDALEHLVYNAFLFFQGGERRFLSFSTSFFEIFS